MIPLRGDSVRIIRTTQSSHVIEINLNSTEANMDVNPDKLNAFMGKIVSDVGSAINASLILVGDKLGLYKALAAKGPMNSAELAKATGTSERYVREWLSAQAASGYVEYDATAAKFSMPPERSGRSSSSK